jgi:hypothetical protein
LRAFASALFIKGRRKSVRDITGREDFFSRGEKNKETRKNDLLLVSAQGY